MYERRVLCNCVTMHVFAVWSNIYAFTNEKFVRVSQDEFEYAQLRTWESLESL